MIEQDVHWQNKVWTGKGTIKQFAEDYNKINAGEMQFATASQLFPTGRSTARGMEYEYLIYYKVHPSALKMLDKQTGKVVQAAPVIMTEKEGKELDNTNTQTTTKEEEIVVV